MNNKHSLRALVCTVSFAGVLLLANAGAAGAAETAIPEGSSPHAPQVIWNVSDVLIETYGTTDWSQVTGFVVSNPGDSGNAEVFLIPLALGNAYLDRYGIWKDDWDSEKALQYFEAVTDGFRLWEKRALTPMITHALVVSVNRMHKLCADHWDLPPVQRKRASVLWKNVKSILKDEAGYRLTSDPIGGSDESDAGDAALFADAASFLPDDSQASVWSDKARELVRASRITGRPISVGFRPVIDGGSTEAEGELDDPAWNLPADHSDMVKQSRIRKPFRGYPWKATPPVPLMTIGPDLRDAVENSKNLLDYTLANYLSHLTPTTSCSEVRYTMPEDGEVQ